MSSETVPNRLQIVVADIFAVSPEVITGETAAGVLEGWDSFGHLQVILALESEFGVQFSPDRIPELVTVEKIQQELAARGITWD